MNEPINSEQNLVSLYDAKRLRVRLRKLGRWAWDTLRHLWWIFIRRGYIAIALGVLLVKGTLEIVWGSIPQMPGKLAESALIMTVIISMFMYRQTVSLISLRVLRMQDRRATAALSPSALGAGPSPETQDAVESHWRTRKAMLWIVLSAFILSLYLFLYQATVREANISHPTTGEEIQQAVVVPPEFMRPEPIRADIQKRIDDGLEHEALDYSLSYNGGLYAYTVLNQYPLRIYAIVVPLNALFILFCVTLTRSLAFAFAPTMKPSRAASESKAEAPNTKTASSVEHKGAPTGSDIGVEILDTLEDVKSMF